MNEVDALLDEGYAALETGDLKRAAKAGKRLRKLKHSAGYEIEARALRDMDKLQDAISLLESGVRAAPHVFILWDYLASYYSDARRYDEALKAYDRVLRIESSPKAMTLANIAVVYQRQGRHENALTVLADVKPENSVKQVWLDNIKAFGLNCLGRFDEAGTLASAALDREQELASEIDAVNISGLLSEYAYAAFQNGQPDAALANAWSAIALDKTCQRAQWLVREISNRRSNRSRKLRVIVSGIWHEPIEGCPAPVRFMSSYTVVADSPAQALDYIKPFEPPEVRDSMDVQRADDDGAGSEFPQGVYHAAQSYTFLLSEKAG